MNETGLDLEVWNDANESETKTGIKSWDSKPWSFEDWRSIRENLDADDASTLGIRFVDSEYQNIVRVSASSVGEELYIMQPPVCGVHNRLSVDIMLREDNVKVIRLRSTVMIENDADIPIIIDISDTRGIKNCALGLRKRSLYLLIWFMEGN